jgi:predicted DNA-binding ribbon-helix-helix protein
MKSLVVKRSMVIDGHTTSVSLEEAFWKSLREIAHERGETLSHLASGIDANRKNANLSSALRVFILEFYKGRSTERSQAFQQREIPVQ